MTHGDTNSPGLIAGSHQQVLASLSPPGEPTRPPSDAWGRQPPHPCHRSADTRGADTPSRRRGVERSPLHPRMAVASVRAKRILPDSGAWGGAPRIRRAGGWASEPLWSATRPVFRCLTFAFFGKHHPRADAKTPRRCQGVFRVVRAASLARANLLRSDTGPVTHGPQTTFTIHRHHLLSLPRPYRARRRCVNQPGCLALDPGKNCGGAAPTARPAVATSR